MTLLLFPAISDRYQRSLLRGKEIEVKESKERWLITIEINSHEYTFLFRDTSYIEPS